MAEETPNIDRWGALDIPTEETKQDSFASLDAGLEQLKKARKKRQETLLSTANGLDQFGAFDALQAVDLALDGAAEAGIMVDPDTMARQYANNSEDGTISTVLGDLYNEFDNKQIATGEQLLGEDISKIATGDVALDDKSVEDLRILRSIIAAPNELDLVSSGRVPIAPGKVVKVPDPTTGRFKYISEAENNILIGEASIDNPLAISPALRDDVRFEDRPEDVSAHISDYIFSDINQGKINKRKREKLKIIATDMALAMKGHTPKEIAEIRSEVQGLEEPFLSPVDLIVDIGTGAVIAKGAKLTGKSLLKRVGNEAFYGQLAGGFMSLADVAGAGPLVDVLAGIVGPTATAGLFLSSRKGIAFFLQSLKDNPRNKTIYRDLSKAIEDAPESRMSQVLKETFEELETGQINLEGERVPLISQSPVAATARHGDGDESVIDKVGETVFAALGDADSATTVLAKQASGTGDFTYDAIIPSPKGSDAILQALEGREELSGFLKNSFDIKKTVAHHILHNTSGADQMSFPEMVRARIYKNNTFAMGSLADDAKLTFEEGTLKAGRRVWQPDVYFGDMADLLVGLPSAAEKTNRAMVKAGQDILDNHIYKGLNNQKARDLDNIFRLGTDNDEILRIAPDGTGLLSESTGKTIAASDDMIQRYYQGRFLMDAFYDAANRTSINELTNRGFKQLDGSFVVEPIKQARKGSKLEIGFKDIDGVAWTKEMEKEGWVAAHIINTENLKDERNVLKFLKPDEHVRLSNIQPTLAVNPLRKGYAPFRIKKEAKEYFVTRIIKDPKTKEYNVKKVAAAATRKEADELITELGVKDPSARYIGHRSSEEADFMDMSVDRSFAQQLRKMDDAELKEFARALKREGINEDEVGAIVSYAKTFGFKGKAEFKKRGTERLRSASAVTEELKKGRAEQIQRAIVARELAGEKLVPEDAFEQSLSKIILRAEEAPLEPTQAAMSNYIQSVSKFINFADLNAKIKDSFMSKYGRELGLSDWNETPDLAKFAAEKASKRVMDLATEATEVQAQMRRMFELPTEQKVAAQNWWANKADWAYSKNLNTVGKGIDKYLKDGVRFGTTKQLKTLGATTKLGLFNLSQFAVQQTSALNAFKYAASNPKELVDGLADFNAAVIKGMVGGKLGLPVDEHSANLLALIKKSGVNTGLHFEHANTIMQQTHGWKGNVKSKLGGVVRAGFLPMQGGEAVGRGITWFTERRVLIKQIKEGKHPRLKPSDIDSDNFIAEVNMKTDATSGNFSRFNQAFVAREGLVSAMTQFWSYPIFQLGTMTPFGGREMHFNQRMGIWAAWAAAFGVEGIPAFWDVAMLGEELAVAAGEPQAKGATRRFLHQADSDFLDRMITKGLITAGTEGEVDFATRAGIAEVANNFIDGLDFSDLQGAGLSTIRGLIGGQIKTTRNLYDLWTSEDFSREAVTKAILPAVQEISGVANPLKATLPKINGREDATLSQRFQQAVGIRPGVDVAIRERLTDAFEYSKSFREFYWTEAKRLAELSESSPKTFSQNLEDTFNFIIEKNPIGARQFQKALNYHLQALALDPKVRVEYIESKKGLDSSIFPE